MGKFIGGLITVGLVILLAMLFLGSVTVRFNLISVHPAFWLYTLGIIFVLGGGWLVAAEIPAGGLFATLGSILLLLAGYKTIWPSTAKASAHAQEVTDSRVALAIDKVVAPNAIRCDRDSKTVFWNPSSGEPIVFFTANEKTGRIECADRKGYHPVSGKTYEPVTPSIVTLIRLQIPPDAPKPAASPTVARSQAPAATPPPDLSEGPIPATQTKPPDLSEGPVSR